MASRKPPSKSSLPISQLLAYVSTCHMPCDSIRPSRSQQAHPSQNATYFNGTAARNNAHTAKQPDLCVFRTSRQRTTSLCILNSMVLIAIVELHPLLTFLWHYAASLTVLQSTTCRPNRMALSMRNYSILNLFDCMGLFPGTWWVSYVNGAILEARCYKHRCSVLPC